MYIGWHAVSKAGELLGKRYTGNQSHVETRECLPKFEFFINSKEWLELYDNEIIVITDYNIVGNLLQPNLKVDIYGSTYKKNGELSKVKTQILSIIF